MFELYYTSASGKRTGCIKENPGNEALKSEEGYVALRTNTPESYIRAIFFKGMKLYFYSIIDNYIVITIFSHSNKIFSSVFYR